VGNNCIKGGEVKRLNDIADHHCFAILFITVFYNYLEYCRMGYMDNSDRETSSLSVLEINKK
jgi:hypothetical protein